MNRLRTLILTLAVISTVGILKAHAWFTGGQELQAFEVRPYPTLTFLQCAHDAAAATTYNFASQNVGAEGARKTIIGIIALDGAITFGVSSVSVGGVAATEVADEDGSGVTNTAIYIVDNPAGTSETVSVTMSEAITNATICLWAAYDVASETAVAFAVDDDTAAGAIVLNLSATTAGGFAVGVCGVGTGAALTFTWTGLTEQSDVDQGATITTAAHLAPTTGGALTVNCQRTGAGTEDTSGSAAAWR